MELDIRPAAQNSFELNGILIRGARVKNWLLELQRMNLSFSDVKIYPLPGSTANSVYGCLLVLLRKPDDPDLGKNEWCQQVSPNLFIAERSVLFPAMQKEELAELFGNAMWFMHPEIGLVELSEELDVQKLVRLLNGENRRVVKPQAGVFIPSEIKSFRLAPVTPEDTLKKLEEENFPKREQLKEKPLNLFEKAKLSFYRHLFRKESEAGNLEKTGAKPSAIADLKESGWLHKLLNRLSPGSGKRRENMLRDFENLEERNRKQIDKLLEMLKNNPNEALKFAIPLDEGGSSRGTAGGALQLNQNWSGFSLFGNQRTSRSGGGAADIGDHYYKLQEQYRSTAEQLIREKEFGKAAFVYMKLLKDNRLAAATLESGELYQDAASVYLKHLNDKPRAADCYEKGNLIENAIELHKELGNYEKTGDLYLRLNRKKEAETYFEQAVEKLKGTNQYIPASKICFDKLKFRSKGQEILLEGWREGKDPENCLRFYFTMFEDPKALKAEVRSVYEKEVSEVRSESFLQVLKQPCFKTEELEESTRELAYEIVSARVAANPGIVKELKSFNPKNKGLLKDTIRFSIRRGKGKS